MDYDAEVERKLQEDERKNQEDEIASLLEAERLQNEVLCLIQTWLINQVKKKLRR